MIDSTIILILNTDIFPRLRNRVIYKPFFLFRIFNLISSVLNESHEMK